MKINKYYGEKLYVYIFFWIVIDYMWMWRIFKIIIYKVEDIYILNSKYKSIFFLLFINVN